MKEDIGDGLYRDDDGEVYAVCPNCEYEQPDMGRNMKCENCGHAPMPCEAADGWVKV